jgi:hypothetical protein
MVRTRISTSFTIGPSLTGLRGTQLTGSIIYTLVTGCLPNSVFTQVVQASVASPESLKKDSEGSEVLHQGAGDFGLYRPETPGDIGDSGLQSPETPGLVNPQWLDS